MMATEFSGKVLALFETDAQLEALLNWRAQAGVDLKLIALTALADYAADKRGLSYATIEDYVDEGAEMAAGIARFADLERFCSWLDAELTAALPNENVGAWFSALDYVYSLKTCLDTVSHRVIGLARLFAAEKPALVIAFPADACSGHPEDAVFWTAWRSTYMAALPLVARRFGVKTGMMPQSLPLRVYVAPPQTPDRWNELAAQVQALRANQGDVVRLLVLGPYWSDRDAPSAAQRRGMPLIRHETLNSPPTPIEPSRQAIFDDFWAKVEHSTEWRTLFTFEGVEAGASVAAVFSTLIRHTVPRQKDAVLRLAERFRQLGNAVLLTSSAVFIPVVIAQRAARLAGIPAVLQQHGGLWYFRSPIIYFAEVYSADYYLCYGEGSAAAVRNLSSWRPRASDGPCALPVSVGCPKAYATWLKHRPSPPAADPARGVRLLYVSSNLSGEELYLSGSRHADIRYWRLQRDAVQFCAALPGVELTVRPGRNEDADNPLRAWFRQSGLTCRFIYEGLLDPLLDDADVIVVDYTSSVLLQALATNAQVVNLIWEEPVATFEPGAEEALLRRAWVPRNREDFFTAIKEAVEAARTGRGLRPLDDTFLKLYGCDPAVNPTDRAAGLLATLPPLRAERAGYGPTERSLQTSTRQDENAMPRCMTTAAPAAGNPAEITHEQ